MSTSTLSPDRQAFRETVALVAEQARAMLPAQVNGRIEKAVTLVLHGDVEAPQADGSVTVYSATDATRRYVMHGAGCTCADFERGQAPEGWCAHRIAANLQRSVERVLARSTVPVEPLVEPWADNDPEPTTPAPLPEAAFSLTLKGTLDGQEALLTARGATADEFRRNLAAIRGLLDPRPFPQPLAPAPSPAATTSPQCPTHSAAKPSTKGQGWYCPHKRDDDTWCPSKGK